MHKTGAPRGLFVAEVASNRPICDQHYRLVLRLGSFPPCRPGQFIQLQCRHMGEQKGINEVDWPQGALPRLHQPELVDKEPLLRRPISLAGRRDVQGLVELDLIYRTIGTGTHWLSSARQGTKLGLMGPLGNAFAIDHPKPLAALIGGGVGIPPMIYLAQALAKANRQVVAFCGIRTRNLLPLKIIDGSQPCLRGTPGMCTEEFAAVGAKTVIATDDGSFGYHGLVSEAFEIWTDSVRPAGGDLAVYCCGPEPMMRNIAGFCLKRGYHCQLALERHMACGVGTCQSCVCKMKTTNEQGWEYKLCCTDGPVFDAGDIVW